jgi:thioredoxin-related protein
VDGLEQTYGSRVSVIRIEFNSEQGQALAQRYLVRNHPTIVVIDRSGTARATIFGVPNRLEVERAIAKVMI